MMSTECVVNFGKFNLNKEKMTLACPNSWNIIHGLDGSNNRHSFSQIWNLRHLMSRCRHMWCLESTQVLGCPFPITSHGARIQGDFPVLVYKGPGPIMRLHFLTSVRPQGPTSSPNPMEQDPVPTTDPQHTPEASGLPGTIQAFMTR